MFNFLKFNFKTLFKSQATKRFFSIFLCLFVGGGVVALAQQTAGNTDAGIGALTEVTTKIQAYIPIVQKLVYVIAGVVAVVGACNVYMKMNNGDQDVTKSIMMLIGACLFLVAAAYALPKFFVSPPS